MFRSISIALVLFTLTACSATPRSSSGDEMESAQSTQAAGAADEADEANEGNEATQPGAESAKKPDAAEENDGDDYVGKFDDRLTHYPYPYEVKTRRFEAQRQPLEMAYMDVAPTGKANGETVLLLHGKNFSGAYWKTTIEPLTKSGYRVVVPDQIGFGKSTKPKHFQFTFHALATHTRALLDELGIGDVTVVGHSMGGMLATRFALMFPDVAKKLVLVNPIGLEDWQKFVGYVPVGTWYENELNKTPRKVRQYMTTAYFDGEWKKDYDVLAELQMGWTESPDYPRIAWVSALTYDMIYTQPVVYDFPRVTQPTLLIIGDRDRTALGRGSAPPEVAAQMGLYDQLGKKTRDAIPNAKLVELDGIGHIPQYEAYNDYIKALMTFLKK